jgi:hypothetical protein
MNATASIPVDHALESADRATKRARLRFLLETGHGFTNVELARECGQRWNGRLHELRRGEDGGRPMVVTRRRLNSRGTLFEYRLVGYAEAPPEPQPTTIVERLRAELRLAHAALDAAGVPRPKAVWRSPVCVSTYGGEA